MLRPGIHLGVFAALLILVKDFLKLLSLGFNF